MTSSSVNLSRRQFFTRRKLDERPQLPWIKQNIFTEQCTQCGDCLDACPQKIIVRSDGGFPRVDFSLGECTFCYQCAESCGEKLFNPKTESAWQAKAEISQTCLAKQNIDCRACGDSCEPFAIQFKPTLGQVAQAQINLDKCTGCGACVAVCPTSAIDIKNPT